jgi:ACS family tartrate transporter-like MFS transporter
VSQADVLLFRKLRLRVMPLLILCFIAGYVDRVNLGFAALALNAKFGFSPTVYGWAAGSFFLGYAAVEIPSNMILYRVGARVWLARIMVTWGIISCLTAFVWNAESLYAARFFLGVAEAGFVPGVMYYLASWFPDRERARTVGWFQCGGPISIVISAPISGWLMAGSGAFGVENWQLLFILEGVPSIILGFVLLKYLAEKPQDVAWLNDEERERLAQRIKADVTERESHGARSLLAAISHPRVIFMSLAYLGIICGLYSVLLWLPLIVKGFGANATQTGWLMTLPYILSILVIVLWTRHSDRTGERTWHLATPCLVAAACLAGSLYVENQVVAFIGIAIAASCIWAAIATFWTLPTAFLAGSAAAVGFALVNSFGNVGGFIGPYLFGYVRDVTGSFGASMLMLGCFILTSAIIVIALGQARAERVGEASPQPTRQ